MKWKKQKTDKEKAELKKKAAAEIHVKKAPKVRGAFFLRLLGLLPDEPEVEDVKRESIFSKQQKTVVTPMTKLPMEPIAPDQKNVPRAETILPSNYNLIGKNPAITRPEPFDHKELSKKQLIQKDKQHARNQLHSKQSKAVFLKKYPAENIDPVEIELSFKSKAVLYKTKDKKTFEPNAEVKSTPDERPDTAYETHAENNITLTPKKSININISQVDGIINSSLTPPPENETFISALITGVPRPDPNSNLNIFTLTGEKNELLETKSLQKAEDFATEQNKIDSKKLNVTLPPPRTAHAKDVRKETVCENKKPVLKPEVNGFDSKSKKETFEPGKNNLRKEDAFMPEQHPSKKSTSSLSIYKDPDNKQSAEIPALLTPVSDRKVLKELPEKPQVSGLDSEKSDTEINQPYKYGLLDRSVKRPKKRKKLKA